MNPRARSPITKVRLQGGAQQEIPTKTTVNLKSGAWTCRTTWICFIPSSSSSTSGTCRRAPWLQQKITAHKPSMIRFFGPNSTTTLQLDPPSMVSNYPKPSRSAGHPHGQPGPSPGQRGSRRVRLLHGRLSSLLASFWPRMFLHMYMYMCNMYMKMKMNIENVDVDGDVDVGVDVYYVDVHVDAYVYAYGYSQYAKDIMAFISAHVKDPCLLVLGTCCGLPSYTMPC